MRLCLCAAVAGLFIATAGSAGAATSAPVATALAASDTLTADAEGTANIPDGGDDSFEAPASAASTSTSTLADTTAFFGLGATPFLPPKDDGRTASREQIYSLGTTPTENTSFEMPAFDTDHDGKVQCVELLKGLLNAPRTIFWKPGRSVMDADDIKPGTAIATFVNGQYPQGPIKGSKHAAIFLRKVKDGIYVLDQYVGQRLAKTRFVPWYNTANSKRANNGHSYSTVVW